MDARIAHLHSHYRLVSAQVVAPELASRLDRVLRQVAVDHYEAALEQALAGDESVYVLRRVKARVTVALGSDATDAALAKSLGSNLAGAVMRAIVRDDGESGNLVRFENHADYVAHFLVALIKGNDRGQWFYHAFAEFSALDRGSAINRVMLDNREHSPVILAYVHRYGELDALLAELNSATKRVLWPIDAHGPRDLDVSRSLFLVALQFVDELAGWAQMPRDGEQLFRDYLKSAVPLSDWRDASSLAVAIQDVVRFLFQRGYLARPQSETSEFLSRLDKTLAGFDWLDQVWLRNSLIELFDKDSSSAIPLPLRSFCNRVTPRQQDLISSIARLVSDGKILNAADPRSSALKLFALLVADSPKWADDAAAKVMIENLMVARRALQAATSAAGFVGCLQRQDIERAMSLVPLDQRDGAKEACRFLSSMGQPAISLLENLAGETELPELVGVESNCAGMALLLRSFVDVRLLTLPDECAYPAESELPRSSMLFLLIAMRVCGDGAVANGRLDEGLCLLTGMEKSLDLKIFSDWCSGSSASHHAQFQEALFTIAAGQRLVQPAIMQVFQVNLPDGNRAVIAADETGILWPLGRVLTADAEVETTVREWSSLWNDATGVQPRIIANDPNLSSLLESITHNSVLPRDEDEQTAYDKGRAALLEAMGSLQQGQTGNPDLDLTTTIVACLLLRVWSRWLRGFSASSVPFLIDNFVRRRGRLLARADELFVELERHPLDLIVEMAGYLFDVEHVPWLSGGRVKFLQRGA